MKIGVLIDALHSGGVEKIAIRQVEALNKIGQEASLLVLKRTNVENYPYLDTLKTIHVVYLDDRLPRLFKLTFKFPFFSFFSLYHLTYSLFIPWVIKSSDASVFISHGTYTTFSAININKIKKLPYFVVIWDPISYIIKKVYTKGLVSNLKFILNPLATILDKLIVRNSAGVIVGGKPHIPYLKSLGAKKIFISYPGVDPAPTLNENRENTILAVTSWNSGKQPEYNLKILEKIPEAKMIFAGSWHPGALQAKFSEAVKKYNLEKRVEITGPLSEVDLNMFYGRCRVLLQTNDDRGFGMPALEAASQGCPFVIPQGQGVGELFTDGEDGFFTKERDTDAIVEKLNIVLKNHDLANKMGENGWKKVIEKYSWKKHAELLVGFIQGR